MPNYDLFNSPIMAATWQNPVNAEFLRGLANAGGAPQLQEAVADEQAQADFNHNITNNAFMAEMANRGAYVANPQSPALVKGFMPGFGESEPPAQQEQAQPQQPQTLTQMARQKALDIINAKNLYAQGEAMGGDQGAQVMQLAHAGAERARADLQQLGVDPAQYGLNGTYEEAAQGLANNDMRTLQNVLDGNMGKTSIAHYDDMYNYLIEQGASREIAAEVAGQRARTYAIQRIKTLEDAFNMYGHDGKVINPMGVQLLQKLGEEEPDMATYYTQRYAGPLQEYAKQNARENAAIQHGYKKEDMAIGHSYDLENAHVAQQYRKELKNIEFQMQEAHANNNVVREVNKAIQLYAAQAKYGIGKGAANRNGISESQVKYAAKMIESIDKQLANGFDLSDEEKKQLQADRANYRSVVDTYLSGGGQQGGGSIFSGAGVDVNDYDSLRRAYQSIVERNAAAYEKNDPNDPPMSWDELNRAFLAEVGEDNPMALNIVENSPYKTGVSSSGGNSASYGGDGGNSPARPMYVDPAVYQQAQSIVGNAQARAEEERRLIEQRRREAAGVRQWNPNG